MARVPSNRRGPSVLLVDPSLSRDVALTLCRREFQVRTCQTASLLGAVCAEDPPDAILVVVPNVHTGLALIHELAEQCLGHPVIVVARVSSEELAIASLNAGIARYLRAPIGDDELVAALRGVTRNAEKHQNGEPALRLRGSERMIGESPSIRSLRARIASAARCNSNVLITGETGTGKELVAELIHENSERRSRPFVSLNSTAIPDSLLESELFGFERGAFTGAQHTHEGKLAYANHGTIFFDEIGDTSAAVQAKLLRALDGKQIYRLGSNRPLPIDVRVLAATNHDLEGAIADQSFRRDLYYRLNVIRVELAPLRDRLADIPLLIESFIRELNRSFGTHVERLSPAAVDALLAHDWPGNIRELKNVLELVFVSLPDRNARIADLPGDVRRRCLDRNHASSAERDRVIRTLVATNWNKSRAAGQLRWSRMTLYRKLVRYRIELPRPLTRGRQHRELEPEPEAEPSSD